MIFEGLHLSCGVSNMVKDGFRMTESTSRAGGVKGVGNSECVWEPSWQKEWKT